MNRSCFALSILLASLLGLLIATSSVRSQSNIKNPLPTENVTSDAAETQVLYDECPHSSFGSPIGQSATGPSATGPSNNLDLQKEDRILTSLNSKELITSSVDHTAVGDMATGFLSGHDQVHDCAVYADHPIAPAFIDTIRGFLSGHDQIHDCAVYGDELYGVETTYDNHGYDYEDGDETTYQAHYDAYSQPHGDEIRIADVEAGGYGYDSTIIVEQGIVERGTVDQSENGNYDDADFKDYWSDQSQSNQSQSNQAEAAKNSRKNVPLSDNDSDKDPIEPDNDWKNDWEYGGYDYVYDEEYEDYWSLNEDGDNRSQLFSNSANQAQQNKQAILTIAHAIGRVAKVLQSVSQGLEDLARETVAKHSNRPEQTQTSR